MKRDGFEIGYIKLTFRRLQTGLSDLKNTKQLKFCLCSLEYNAKILKKVEILVALFLSINLSP